MLAICANVSLSDAVADAKFATASSRFPDAVSCDTLPTKPCCCAVVDCISFWIWYSWENRNRKLLNVFWAGGSAIQSRYANWYLPHARINVSAALISCCAVNAAPPAVANLWHSSICLKIRAIGR